MNNSQQKKNTRITVFILASLVLLLLPIWITLQDMLTRLVMNIGWYKNIQNVIVPIELRIVGGILAWLGFQIEIGPSYIGWLNTAGNKEVVYIIWNCVGWQSLVFLICSFFTGLAGNYTLVSKIETLIIGVLGTYIMNLIRLVVLFLVYIWVGRNLGIVFHDYFSNILTLLWLFFFWWFSYRYVLEEKRGNLNN